MVGMCPTYASEGRFVAEQGSTRFWAPREDPGDVTRDVAVRPRTQSPRNAAGELHVAVDSLEWLWTLDGWLGNIVCMFLGHRWNRQCSPPASL